MLNKVYVCMYVCMYGFWYAMYSLTGVSFSFAIYSPWKGFFSIFQETDCFSAVTNYRTDGPRANVTFPFFLSYV